MEPGPFRRIWSSVSTLPDRGWMPRSERKSVVTLRRERRSGSPEPVTVWSPTRSKRKCPAASEKRRLSFWSAHRCETWTLAELRAWHADRSRWPEDRSWEVFNEWFEVEVLDAPWDLGAEPLPPQLPPG